MYKRILVCLENSATDEHIVDTCAAWRVTARRRWCSFTWPMGGGAQHRYTSTARIRDARRPQYLSASRRFRQARRDGRGGLATGDPVEARSAPPRIASTATDRDGYPRAPVAGDVIHGSTAAPCAPVDGSRAAGPGPRVSGPGDAVSAARKRLAVVAPRMVSCHSADGAGGGLSRRLRDRMGGGLAATNDIAQRLDRATATGMVRRLAGQGLLAYERYRGCRRRRRVASDAAPPPGH